jgi:type I restriction enzyme R subunit/putative DNA methylase
MTSKPWRNRGYLPHFDGSAVIQSITFRLADSLSQDTLARLERELENVTDDLLDAERRKQIEGWLDAGMGSCALAHPQLAVMVEDALLHGDGDRYRMLAWCVMPNHVHALIEPTMALGKIVQSWKSYTGRWARAHAAELGYEVTGDAFWMREYWDRYIRDETHFLQVVDYIHRNPVAAGLCSTPEDWRWSSAAKKRET